jgi:hypothetical protein
MQVLYHEFLKAMDKACLRFRVTSTGRDYKVQVALYAQGRESLANVNAYRMAAGLSPITEKENRNRVTWTLNSLHVIRRDDNDPDNDYAEAFDIVLYNGGGRAHYDVKVDANAASGPDYDEAGRIGESVGLVWGGRFRNPDRPHYQRPA